MPKKAKKIVAKKQVKKAGRRGRAKIPFDKKALLAAIKVVKGATTQRQALQMVTDKYCSLVKGKVSLMWIWSRMNELNLLGSLPKGKKGRQSNGSTKLSKKIVKRQREAKEAVTKTSISTIIPEQPKKTYAEAGGVKIWARSSADKSWHKQVYGGRRN